MVSGEWCQPPVARGTRHLHEHQQQHEKVGRRHKEVQRNGGKHGKQVRPSSLTLLKACRIGNKYIVVWLLIDEGGRENT